MKNPALLAVSALLLVPALAACSSPGTEAAKVAYDECADPEAEFSILEHKGNTVSIVVDGEYAKALSGTEDQIDDIMAGRDVEKSEGPSGLAVSLAIVTGSKCLADATGFPGASDDLADGDEWDGWAFTEKDGAGSSFTATFTATS